MVYNTTNINKTNTHHSPQTMEHTKDHDIRLLAWDMGKKNQNPTPFDNWIPNANTDMYV